jgi:hypothetical protein
LYSIPAEVEDPWPQEDTPNLESHWPVYTLVKRMVCDSWLLQLAGVTGIGKCIYGISN